MVNGNDMNAYSEERCKVRTKGRFQTIVNASTNSHEDLFNFEKSISIALVSRIPDL